MKNGLAALIAIILTATAMFGGCDMNEPNQNPQTESAIFTQSTEDISNVPETSDKESSEPETVVPQPEISLSKTEFSAGETITVKYANTDSKDWIGFYPEGSEPGSINSLIWDYSVGDGALNFSAQNVGAPGVYWIFLCDNDGYKVLDMETITILDSDTTNYGAKSVETEIKGYSSIHATIEPSCDAELTYKLYWSSNNIRLDGYEPLYTVTHSGGEKFTVELNDYLFMPDEADGIEVAVIKGRSESVFTSVSNEMKLPESNLLYKFNVITDLHITPSRPAHESHLSLAFADIIAQGDSSAIITCGDNTDRGTVEEYGILLDIVAQAGEKLPDIYYAIGNHDVVYNNNAGYDNQIKLFKEKTGMPGAYYSFELNGNKFIILGSDTAVGEGTVGEDQLNWLKNELSTVNKDEPVFLFLHQPLIETVSGSLYSQNNEIQDWYGIIDTSDEIRAILKNYPNAFLFTGHTHWTLDSKQPILAGKGEDATFVNCSSVGYLWNDNDESEGGSEGYYIEVYEDYILLRGREFLKGNWVAAAQFVIPITK